MGNDFLSLNPTKTSEFPVAREVGIGNTDLNSKKSKVGNGNWLIDSEVTHVGWEYFCNEWYSIQEDSPTKA